MSKHHHHLGSRRRRWIKRALVRQHGWWCHLCWQPIDQGTADPMMRLSVDHVVPISVAYSWDLKNLRPAHAQCNSDRHREVVA